MMSLSVLHAGDGYAYLTRSVATGDRNRGPMSLTDYYSASGTPPGRWFGKGLASLGKGHLELAEQLAVAGQVTEAQMLNLFGLGLHPNQEAVHLELLSRAFTRRQIRQATIGMHKATKLGRQFPQFTNDIPVLAAITAAAGVWKEREGRPVTAHVRAAITAEVAPAFFADAKGRVHENSRELASWVAHQQRQVRQPVAGYDFTFTPAKSVSVMWALADKETSAKILDIHHRAVDDALEWMEAEAAFARGGSGGTIQLDVEGLIVARFDHWDTRSGDPNLHTHCAVSNKVLSADGTWRALDGTAIFRNAVAASERYNARIAELMAAEMGVEFEAREPAPGTQPVMEIAGVSSELIDAFSRRRSDIEVRRDVLVSEYRAKHGRSPSKDTEYALLQQATLDTREGKQEPVSLDQIRAAAMDRAAQVTPAADLEDFAATVRGHASVFGLPDYLTMHLPEQVAAAAAEQGSGKPMWMGHQEAAKAIVALVSERRADWTPAHVRARAEAVSSYFTFDTPDDRRVAVEHTVTAALSEHSVRLSIDIDTAVPTALRRANGESVFTRHNEQTYTSVEILEAEEALRTAAHEPTIYSAYNTTLHQVAAELRAESGRELNAGQSALVRHFCQSGSQLAVGTGPAGAGKTTAMSAVVRIWKAEGREVIALAPSAAAATVLGDEVAADGRTIASLTYPWRGLLANKGVLPRSLPKGMSITPGTMLLVDEAAMASTKDLAAIHEIAAVHGGIVRLLGDPAQLDAVETGGALRMLAGDTHAPELTDVVRFGADSEQAENSLLLREGDPTALGMFARRGWITSGTTNELLDSVFAAFTADTEAGVKSLMLASTNQEIFGLNTRAQLWNQDRGAVSGDRPCAGLADGQSAFTGDRVVTRTNNRQLRTVGGTRPGASVLNGDLWTVQAVHDDGSLTVRHLEHEGTAMLPARYVAASTQLGYASTIHRAQGMTVDISRAVIGKMTDRAGAYVALTRGRTQNHAYVSDSIDLDADIEVHQLGAEPEQQDGLTRLTHVLGRDTHTIAASTQIEHALEAATSRDTQLTAYTHGQALLRDEWITGLLVDVLGSADDVRAREHPEAYASLRAAVGRIHDAGHDPAAALEAALARGEVDTADNVAGVLGARLGAASRVQALEVPPLPPAYAGMDRELADWARQLQTHLHNPVPVPEREAVQGHRLPSGALARLTDGQLRSTHHNHRADLTAAREARAQEKADYEQLLAERPSETRARAALARHNAAVQIMGVRDLDEQIKGVRARAEHQRQTQPRRRFRAEKPNPELEELLAKLQGLEQRRAYAATGLPKDVAQWLELEGGQHVQPDMLVHAIDKGIARDAQDIDEVEKQIADRSAAIGRIRTSFTGVHGEVERRRGLPSAQRGAEDRARARLGAALDSALPAADIDPVTAVPSPGRERTPGSLSALSHPRPVREVLRERRSGPSGGETCPELPHIPAPGHDSGL